jgi:hypothetical protein
MVTITSHLWLELSDQQRHFKKNQQIVFWFLTPQTKPPNTWQMSLFQPQKLPN